MGPEDWVLKGTKVGNKYIKAKIKDLEQSLEFQKCDVNEKKKEKKEKKRTKKNKQGHENYKENTGTKLITNTKKQKLKIQSRVGISKIRC